MPQINTLDGTQSANSVWHGVVFVRFGIFKDGKFKFKILFDEFPKKPPKVYFMTEVWHPMVNHETGLLDLGAEL